MAAFQTPININGLTVIGVMSSHFKGDNKSDRDSDYWGFYLADSPGVVLSALRTRYGVFSRDFPKIGIMPVDLKFVTESENKYYTVGLMAETTTDMSRAKTLLTCSIQRHFGAPGK